MVLNLELEKIAILINESVDLDEMVDIVEENFFEPMGNVCESLTMLNEEDEAKAKKTLAERFAAAKNHISTGKANKAYLGGLLAALSVAAVALVAMKRRGKVAAEEEGEPEELEEDIFDLFNLEEELEFGGTYGDKEKAAKAKGFKAGAERAKARVKGAGTSAKAKYNATSKKQKGLAALVGAGISLVAAYFVACKKNGVAPAAPVKSALNRIKNTFKREKSNDPANADQYEALADRVDAAIDKVDAA